MSSISSISSNSSLVSDIRVILSDTWLLLGISLFVASFALGVVLATKHNSIMTGVIGVLNILAYICITVSIRNDKRKRIRDMLANQIPIKNVSVEHFPKIPLDKRAKCYVDEYLQECTDKMKSLMTKTTETYDRLKTFIDHLPTGKHAPEGEELVIVLELRTSIAKGISQLFYERDKVQLFTEAFKIENNPHQAEIDQIESTIKGYQDFIIKYFKVEEL
jgi:hypothetical protein